MRHSIPQNSCLFDRASYPVCKQVFFWLIVEELNADGINQPFLDKIPVFGYYTNIADPLQMPPNLVSDQG